MHSEGWTLASLVDVFFVIDLSDSLSTFAPGGGEGAPSPFLATLV